MISLPELMKELQMAEGILKNSRGVHMAVKDSSGFSHNKKNTFKKSEEGTRERASVSFVTRRATRGRNALTT